MIKLLIVDDHTILRAGLKHVFYELSDFGLIGEASTGTEAINKLRNEAWDVVLLDLSMPGKSGLEVIRQIKKEISHVSVLVLSMHPENQYAVRVIREGAAGYLTKLCSPEELITAVRRVAAGGRYISGSVAEKLALSVDMTTKEEPHESLSDREYQVFYNIVSGKQVSEIAQKLSLSVKTISTHRSNILKKMNMKNNAELMFYAMTNDLVDKLKNPESFSSATDGAPPNRH